MKFDKKLLKKERFERSFEIESGATNEEERTVDVSFSSEMPCERWFGKEILDHSPDSANLSRLNKGGAVFVDHSGDQIGVVAKAEIRVDRRGYATLKFSRSVRGQEVFQDIIDGIRKNISFGYKIDPESMIELSDDTYRMMKWEPLEISVVGIPADASIGVGRSLDNSEKVKPEVQIESKNQTQIEVKKMADEIKNIGTPVIEIKSDDKKRVREILAIAENHPELMKEARDAIEKDVTLEDFQRSAMSKLYKKPEAIAPTLGLNEKEQKSYSFMKAIRALSNPGDAHAQKSAAFELECSRAWADKVKKEPNGLFVPYDIMLSRAFNQTTGAGSNLIATNLMADMFIELLRKRTVVDKVGAMMLSGLVGNVAIPAQTAGSTAYWIDTESAAITAASNPTIGQVSLTPHTVGAYTEISRSLLKQSTPDAENLVRNDLIKVLALAIDLAALKGTNGNGQPKGITLQTGIGSGAWATDNSPSWDKIVAMETAIETAEALAGNLFYVMGSSLVGKCKTTLKTSNVAGYIMDSDGSMNGYDVVRSNQLAAGEALFGDFSQLIIGMWGGLDLQVNPYALDTQGAVRVTALQDVDVAVRHTGSFAFYQNPTNS